MRLLEEINKGNLVWMDLIGATVTSVTEELRGEKYCTKIVFKIVDKYYVFQVSGKKIQVVE